MAESSKFLLYFSSSISFWILQFKVEHAVLRVNGKAGRTWNSLHSSASNRYFYVTKRK